MNEMCGRNGFSIAVVLLAQVTLGLSVTGSVLAQDQWQQLKDMPVEKWEAGTVVLDDQLYFFGGYTKGVKSSKRCDVFDPKDNTWTRIQDLPSAITHMNMVLDGRTVWFADDTVISAFSVGVHSGEMWGGNAADRFRKEAEQARAFLA